MRPSAFKLSSIPVRTDQQKRVDALQYQSNLSSVAAHASKSKSTSDNKNQSGMTSVAPQRGLGISVSPSRLPVRALDDRMKSVFANATMVQDRKDNGSQNSNNVNKSGEDVARAQNISGKLSEPFHTPLLGVKNGPVDTPSPTYSTSISPSFIVRNLDDDPHTGLTPVGDSYGPKKVVNSTSRLSSTQLPSPPSSPRESREFIRSRPTRHSKDDIALAESSRKLQAASFAKATRPRRKSIPVPLSLNTLETSETMTVPLEPPAPITIPPNDFIDGYPIIEKPPPSSKTPGALASLFRWNTVPVEHTPERQLLPERQLHTPSSSSSPLSPMTPTSPSLAALEQELRSVSADLAFSIRREMDLEDVITRLQDEIVRLGGEGKRQMRFRTSDYFSENSVQGSPPFLPVDELERKGHSRKSSVALEDMRMANEKVTQLEKEVLALKHENLELTSTKRDLEKKLKDQKSVKRDSQKVRDLELVVEQLQQEVSEKSRIVETLQQSINDSKVNRNQHADEIEKLTERAKGAESQREALQLALRQLRERQALEAKRATDRIKQLESEKNQRQLPRTPERPVTGIGQRTPDSGKKSNTKKLDEKIKQLQSDLAKANKELSSLSVTNTQLSNDNTRLLDMQQRLQSRLSQMEAAASASTIGEASATASLSYAHRLAVEMARVTDIHVKSLEKVRNTTNATLPHLTSGKPLSPMLQSAYDFAFSPKRRSVRATMAQDTTSKEMEERIKELESALKESTSEMGEVVRRMQMAQIEMIELAGERDEALRRERKLLNDNANLVDAIDGSTKKDIEEDT